jgi:hypothetical protein
VGGTGVLVGGTGVGGTEVLVGRIAGSVAVADGCNTCVPAAAWVSRICAITVAAIAVEVALIPPWPWFNCAETVSAAEVSVAAGSLRGSAVFDCKLHAPKIKASKARKIHNDLRDVNISSSPIYDRLFMIG